MIEQIPMKDAIERCRVGYGEVFPKTYDMRGFANLISTNTRRSNIDISKLPKLY